MKFTKNNKLKIVLLSMLGTIILSIILSIILFYDSIATVASITQINDIPTYKIKYHGDYCFDKYLKTGADSPEVLQKFLKQNLFYGIGNKIISDKHGCSAFIAKTPNGDVIFARNFDANTSIPAIIETDPQNGYNSISMTNFALMGGDNEIYKKNFSARLISVFISPYVVLDGMNKHGLAVAVFTAEGSKSSIDKNKTTLMDQTILRALLDKSKNVAGAIQFLKQYNVSFFPNLPVHYMIADRNGNSAVIEYVDGKMQVINKQGDYQIVSNFILYNNPEKLGIGAERYKAYEAVLSKTKGVMTSDSALKLLEKNTTMGQAQWSVVYNLTRSTMIVSFFNDNYKIYRYSI